MYPIVFAGNDDVPSGAYHYNIKDHTLETLSQRPFGQEDVAELFTYKWALDASFAIVMTATFYRNQMKYGERGYRYILLEAGHIGQNIYLSSQAVGLRCCSIVGSCDKNIEKLLDIDGITESVIYSVMVG